MNFDDYHDIHIPAVILKTFLRELPEPLLTFDCYDHILEITSECVYIYIFVCLFLSGLGLVLFLFGGGIEGWLFVAWLVFCFDLFFQCNYSHKITSWGIKDLKL